MDTLQKITQQCHERKHRRRTQRETIVLPAGYNESLHHYRVHYAHKKSAMLYELEKANISFMPIGEDPFDRPPANWHQNRIKHRQRAQDWEASRWFASWGIGIYTGKTSGEESRNWHDIEFTHQAILNAPDEVSACWEALINSVVNPLVTLTKEGGVRFTCRVIDYLHPNTTDARQYVYKHLPERNPSRDRDVYVEIIGDKGYSCWDARYEILMGSLLDPPVMSKDVLFAFLDVLRELLHDPTPTSALDGIDTPTAETEEWSDFDVIEALETQAAVDDRILAVRRGELSPLSIKRSRPLLRKSESVDEGEDIFDRSSDIHGLITGPISPNKKREIESTFLQTSIVCLNSVVAYDAENAERYYEEHGVSVGRWKPRNYRWEEVKEIPIADRMQNPFVHGNVCEDAERCDVLENKGGDPTESICPVCPVYKECQEHGYLSQLTLLPEKQVIILEIPNLFFDQRHEALVDRMIEEDRLCIVNDVESQMAGLFPMYQLSKDALESWIIHRNMSTLGQFAKALLNAMLIAGDQHGDIVKRVRTIMYAFESLEDTLIRQMCQVLCPIDKDDSKVEMSMDEAIKIGVLDASRTESIEKFPTVYRNPNWTLWHQLKFFFSHYSRDADAPMFTKSDMLQFWLPPVLHQRINKLIFMSPSFSEAQLKQVFPDASISVKRVNSSETSLRGNQIFQLRSAPHISDAITNYEVKWDVFSLSEIGMRYFIGIQREMENHPDRNHVVISSGGAAIMLKDVLIGKIISYNDLVTEVSEHIEFLRSILEDADVIWIVGTPYSPPHFIWRQAKILFGHHAAPLCYDLIMLPYYFQDERIQTLYEHSTVGALTQIISNVGFNDASDKTLILNTPLRIPYITDAPETMLFDWEDLEIGGGLDQLSETIVQREAYQDEYAEMDASWSRERVEFLFGVSASQANRILKRLRGGLRARPPLEVQIFNLLADGEKTTAELIDGVQGNPGAVKNELTKLVRQGEIVRIQQGVYDLA